MSTHFPPLHEPESMADWQDRTQPSMAAMGRLYRRETLQESSTLLLSFGSPMVAVLYRACGHDYSEEYEAAEAREIVARLDEEMAQRLLDRPKELELSEPRPAIVSLRMTSEEWLAVDTSLCVMKERPVPTDCPRCADATSSTRGA